MHKTTALLLGICLWMPAVSVVYFMGLVYALPFALVAIITVILLHVLLLTTHRMARIDAVPEVPRKSGLLLVAGIVLMCGACALLGRRYGDFDAALIWNLHARYLANGADWLRIYRPGVSGNAAYPFGLPGFVAAGWRAVGSFTPVVPYTVAFLATVGIPVVVFLQTARRQLLVGAGVLAAFGLYPYYIALGLDQYADIQVAWLFLLSAVCVKRLLSASSQTSYATILGTLLGALCWTKYEGFLLSAVLLVWHPGIFKRLENLTRLAIGALPFVAAWLVLRQQGAPASPLVQNPATIAAHVREAWRYQLTAEAFGRELTSVHLPLAALLVAYPLLCLRLRLPLSPLYGALCTTILGFAAVYVLLVTTDMDWNLRFSLPRLLLQLYPTLVFNTAARASEALERRRETLRTL